MTKFRDDDIDLIDMDQLLSVLAELGEDLYVQLLGQLSDDGQALLQNAGDQQGGPTLRNLDAELRALKGAAATLGLGGVGANAQTLRDKPDATRTDVAGLIDILHQSVAAARRVASG
ncbi:hypothetical protein MWU61_10465 [Loktanella sp. F6476L]|uniref:hypothetical protein n=1 Tax=Loktanella sp. F6476L TaxID=2926405 RepID=UPI001FF3F98A|nr:hypothetical protein [Loktanella sp. F6476L]MCK0120966.1 hypothetical protein [Loktanella sp. F6476L]